MALYRCEAKRISRTTPAGGGRSVVAAAAYRHAALMDDPLSGRSWDFRGKRGVNHSETILPAGAPAWMRDPHELWASVELSEKRKDACLAKEWILSLPLALPSEAQIVAGREFGIWLAGKGMVADLAFHELYGRGKDVRHQPHLHILASTREVTADGWGKKVRAWDHKDLVIEARQVWEDVLNKALEASRSPERVSRLSRAARGLEGPPEGKVGPRIHHAAQRGQAWAIALEDRLRNRLKETPHAASSIRPTPKPDHDRDWWTDDTWRRWSPAILDDPGRMGERLEGLGTTDRPLDGTPAPAARTPWMGVGGPGLAGSRPRTGWSPLAVPGGIGNPTPGRLGSSRVTGWTRALGAAPEPGSPRPDSPRDPAAGVGQGPGAGHPAGGDPSTGGVTWSLDDELPEPITETPDLDWFGGEVQDLPGPQPPPTRPKRPGL